nr:RNA polymerase II-associated protein 1 isoform X3 [Macaca fascicularis]
MLSRPKPGESEMDLLRFQSQFLAAGAAPAVQLVKKGNRGGSDANSDRPTLQDHRDVVMLDNLPDLPPALVPSPPKRARSSPCHPLPEDEDPEEKLRRHDQHITAVLTKIIERDTSSVTVNLPMPSGVAFPAVFHRSRDTQGKSATSGKRSIFAQEIAARRIAEARVPSVGEVVPNLGPPEGAVTCETPTPRDQGCQLPGSSHSFQGPNLVTGKGLRDQEAEQEAQTIHEENIARLQAMAPEEILQEQQRLLAQLDPSLVAFLRSHSRTQEQTGEKASEERRPGGPSADVTKEKPLMSAFASEPRKGDKLEPEAPALALPMTPQKEWLHMDTVELEKLHWTQDLPPLRRQQTQERMQARFSIQGELLAPDVDLPTHLGLHHHGEEAERAGYSLQELFHLTRSQVSQQRALALHVLAQVISRAQAGEFGDRLAGSVLSLLLDAGFLFLLRFSLDDRVDGVIAAAIRALRALLVAPGDEELLDSTFSWYHGALTFPLMPSQEDKEDEDEDEECPAEKAKRKSPEEESRPPPDLARHDVIKGLLATSLLPRLRYLLEVTYPGPAVVLDILAVLIRLARHSLESATRPSSCPEDWLQDMERLSEELLLPLLSQPTLGGLWDSLRHCSPLCNPLSCAPAPEAPPSLVSLGCSGGCPSLSLAGSASPFPFLTALLSLLNTLAQIHKGLCGQLAAILAAPGLQNYFLQCVAPGAAPHLTPFSAWALRHEYHLQYLALALAQKAAALQLLPAPHAALHHGMALALLSRLLPGSEHLAHELLLSCVFRLELLPERTSGGPEAADFSDQLSLGSSKVPWCGQGTLLAQACQDLPSIRSCYLTHCLPARASLLASQALHRGELQRVPTLLLPVPMEPLLPTDWPFLPLIHLYHRASDTPSGLSPMDTVGTAMRVLQWVLVLESWRPQALWAVPPAARLARLMCVFLVDSELFRESRVQHLVAALLAQLCQPQILPNLNLDCPLPGLTSFPDLYANFLDHFEAVSFGDHLFGALVLLPLQRRFSVTLRLALFGEHVGALRALSLPLTQLPVSLEYYTVPPEDNLALLQLYFRTLVTGALRPHWCPVLYAVAVAHVNSFIFSQDPQSSDEVKAARRTMLQKTWLLADEGLRQHLLHYKLPNSTLPEGFELYSQLPPLRQHYLQRLTSTVLPNGVSET